MVTVKNSWSGSLHGRVGYDFGVLFPYVILGVGLSNASVGTNGNAPDKKVSVGRAFGYGVEADFNENWSGQIEAIAITTPKFTPNGGGGRAETGVGEVRVGLVGRF